MKSASTGSRDASRSSSPDEADTDNGKRGFSLLEVLAALTILAIALSSLYGSFSTALRAGDSTAHRLAAVQLAQSLLDQQISGRVVQQAVMRGRQDRYQWLITIEPVEDEQPPPPGQTQRQPQQQGPAQGQPPALWQLYQIAVTVSWPRERRVRLDTLHLVRAP